MSHKEQKQFIEKLKSKYLNYFHRKFVLEVGSLYLNGTIRDLFTECTYVGLDLQKGPLVDLVCSGHKYNAPDESYDVACSTECFEHDVHWLETFKNMIRLCNPNGLVFFTCATEGRSEHGTSVNQPYSSPFTNDYYQNLKEEDFTSKINFDDYFSEYHFEVDNTAHDLYFYGLKLNTNKHFDIKGRPEMNITLYAICKNEEKNVEKFIENSKKFSDTVVVDTGSTDNTVQLLRDAGIQVYEHPQTRDEFDFSKVRNQALSYVKTDWAFSLDFNEDLDEFFPEGLGVIAGEFTTFNHQRYDKVNDGEPTLGQTAHTRFHRTKNYTWVNAVHESPIFIPTEEHLNEIAVDTTIKITKNVHNTVDKQLFYLSICEREFKNDPTNTYYLWFIFKHYFEVKNLNKALELGQEYLNLSRAYFDPTRIDVFIMCSIALINSQDVQRASNYAFHAVSEAMNVGGDVMGKAFTHLLNIGKLTQNPNITVFASGFNPETLRLKERTDAIDKLFLTNLDDTPGTAWGGHRAFAEWLVKDLNPNVIVDLGVFYGFSTFSFAIPRIGHTYGIDNFVGDDFVGTDENRLKYNFVTMKREKLHLQDNLTLIEGDFNEVAQTWDKKIDILHIDGSHKYEDIKQDFETWSKFLNDDGVILMHDTCIESLHGNDYGVKKFFDELDMPKFTFTHCFGLGVICKNEVVLNHIKNNFT